jgi:glycosyltransferase involved in cell wall biosynthesis
MTMANTPLDFTVAIATYNGANRVAEVLECLRLQTRVEQFRWEIIVVDNNSTDNTADVIRRYQKNWPQLRYVFEPVQGAGYARNRAVRLAQSPLIGFLDDDNLPASDWVYQAYQFAVNKPGIGVIGSRIDGQFDSELPKNFERIAPFLALTDRGDVPLIYKPEKKVLPPGAGMVVRREAWLHHLSQQSVLGGRTQDSMLTGEDVEAVLHIQRAGWEIWYNPAMRLEHKIPAHRLTRPYLVSLMRGIGLSRHRTRMLSVSKAMRWPMMLAYALNDIRKIVRSVLKYGPQTWTDTVTVSEMTLYIYSLLSPLFFLKMGFVSTLPKRWGQNVDTTLAMQDQHI